MKITSERGLSNEGGPASERLAKEVRPNENLSRRKTLRHSPNEAGQPIRPSGLSPFGGSHSRVQPWLFELNICSDRLYFCAEEIKGYAWTPRTPIFVEK
ncbi:hypothetical protein E3N88_45048 [Mikania micrantha]|uniref:Uncharacterized protein n=1 Tax=Mikania micrantha TaxID=192012 RepID=A0A5N6LAA1_9ASTR|nr:hypothetical protein E3N88_45048 [Mikania micrantha]